MKDLNNKKLRNILKILKEFDVAEFSYENMSIKLAQSDAVEQHEQAPQSSVVGRAIAIALDEQELIDAAKELTAEETEKKIKQDRIDLETWSA
jgi:hypothetical protein